MRGEQVWWWLSTGAPHTMGSPTYYLLRSGWAVLASGLPAWQTACWQCADLHTNLQPVTTHNWHTLPGHTAEMWQKLSDVSETLAGSRHLDMLLWTWLLRQPGPVCPASSLQSWSVGVWYKLDLLPTQSVNWDLLFKFIVNIQLVQSYRDTLLFVLLYTDQNQ